MLTTFVCMDLYVRSRVWRSGYYLSGILESFRSSEFCGKHLPPLSHLTSTNDKIFEGRNSSLSLFSRYIPPDKREENDQSTHKWMVYVRGSRREPSINHFVKKVWFFLHPSYKPNDLVEVR